MLEMDQMETNFFPELISFVKLSSFAIGLNLTWHILTTAQGPTHCLGEELERLIWAKMFMENVLLCAL